MKQLYLWLCAGLMMASCAHSELGNEPQGGSGPVSRVAFSAAIQPQYTLHYDSAEGADVDLDQIQWPGAADFTLDILSGGSVVQSHPAGTIPSELELYVGAYSLHAHSGADTETWNVPYLEGRQDFSLSSSSTSFNAQLACGLKSTLVYLVFDESFAKIFSDYTAYLNTDHTQEAWVWTAGEKRVACMRPTEQLLIRVDVTMRANGNKYNYGINPLVDLKAGELNVVRFSMVGGEVNATISADNGVTVTQKTVQLQADWLATRKTSIQSTFAPTDELTNVYGLAYHKPTDIVVRSNAGIKSLVLKATGDLERLLGVGQIDLLANSAVAQKMGLRFDKATNPVVGSTQVALFDGRLNLRGCFNTLPVLSGEASEYPFTVEAVDLLNQTSTLSAKISIRLPQRSVGTAQSWNRYAYIPAVQVIEPDVDPASFSFSYVIRTGTGEWKPLGQGHYAGNAQPIYTKGLEPATTYTAAIDWGNGRYEPIAQFTTDYEPQVPNGDFEQYQYLPYAAQTLSGKYFEHPFYELYASGATGPRWATTNAATTYNRATSYQNFGQSYPSVQMVESPTSGKAVQIQTVGWGPNSKIDHGKKLENVIFQVDTYRNSYDKAAAGKIFIGSYTYNPATETHGMPIDRKPKALRFYYKYIPKAGAWEVKFQIWSDATLIGTAQMSDDQPELGREVTLPIVYQRLDLTPTHCTLYFVSQNSAPAANATHLSINYGQDERGSYKAFVGTQWVTMKDSYYFGATLVVDDVQLVYVQDKDEQYTIN